MYKNSDDVISYIDQSKERDEFLNEIQIGHYK